MAEPKFKPEASFDAHIDEDILIKLNNDELIAYVESHFKSEQLLFSILEISLSKNELGTTYIYKEEDAQVYDKYIGIVKKFKDEIETGGISSYIEWYHEKPWVLIKNNNIAQIKGVRKADYGWNYHSERKIFNSYGTKKGLNEAMINNYLGAYQKIMHENIFHKYPFYFIIIKPLTHYIPPNNKSKALGNLYIHIALNKAIEIDEIVLFFNQLQIIIFKKYGGLFIKEALENLLKNKEISTKLNLYSPNLPKASMTTKTKLLQFIIDEDFILKYQEQTDKLINSIVDCNFATSKIDNYIDGLSRPVTKKDDDLNVASCLFYFAARLCMLKMIKQGYKINEIHKFITKGGSTGDPKNMQSYLNSTYDMIISFKENKIDIQKAIEAASPYEKSKLEL